MQTFSLNIYDTHEGYNRKAHTADKMSMKHNLGIIDFFLKKIDKWKVSTIFDLIL